MAVKFLQPTTKLIQAIADDMRQADVDEIWASSHKTPYEALLAGLKQSDHSVVISVNDELCVMLGLVIHDILSGTGVVWLLGTENSLKYKREFITLVPDIISEMLDICPKLFNYVHTENKVSVKWLKRIGFTFDEPQPYGCEREMFQKFYLERAS